MAVSLVNSAEQLSNAAGGSISVSVPTGLANGDLWFIAVVVDTNAVGNEVVDLPSGWSGVTSTLIVNPSGAQYPATRCIYKQAGASESAVTITFSGGSAFYSAYAVNCRISGQSGTPLGDVQTSNATGGSDVTSVDAPDVSVADNGSLVLLWIALQQNIPTEPSGTTMAQVGGTAYPCGGLAYIARDAGTYAPGNWTFSASRPAAQTIVIQPAASSTAVPVFSNHYRQQGIQ